MSNAKQRAVAESVTATVLLAWLDGKNGWDGQPHELHAALKEHAATMKISEKQFPATPPTFGKKLREVRPSLLALGYKIDFADSDRPRLIRITRINGKSPDGSDAPDGADRRQDGTDSTDSKIPHLSGSQEPDPGDRACEKCGQKIVERVWPDGRRDWGCQGCGRRAAGGYIRQG